MIELNTSLKNKISLKSKQNKTGLSQAKKLASIGRTSTGIINELYSPIDAINRFINLALQSLAEDSQSRQFLIESKKGIRKTSLLLRKLNICVKRIEQEIDNI